MGLPKGYWLLCNRRIGKQNKILVCLLCVLEGGKKGVKKRGHARPEKKGQRSLWRERWQKGAAQSGHSGQCFRTTHARARRETPAKYSAQKGGGRQSPRQDSKKHVRNVSKAAVIKKLGKKSHSKTHLVAP